MASGRYPKGEPTRKPPPGWPDDVSLDVEPGKDGVTTVRVGITFHVAHQFGAHEIVNEPMVLERLRAGIVEWIARQR